MKETAVLVENGPVVLSGTLTEPAGDATALVVCLHGSGPLDRDENMRGQRLDVFNAFAEAFASVGIATVRYDKRGCGASTGDFLSAGQDDLAEDARAVVGAMRQRGFSRVVLLGHSEGTLIAARLAGVADALVLLAPFITPIREILLRQSDEMQKEIDAAGGWSGRFNRLIVRVLGGTRRMQERLIARLQTTRAPVLRHYGRKLDARNLRDLISFDPEAIYRSVRLPVLAIAGGKDVQCPPSDAARIAAVVGPSAEAHLFADLTHLLRKSEADAGFADYTRQMRAPVDEALLAVVTKWVKERFPSM